MKKLFTGLLLFLTVFSLNAKDKPEYAVGNIPLELRTNVDAVVRQEKRTLELLPNYGVKRTEFSVVTIFNDRADDLSQWSERYDPYTKINFVKCKVYNAKGEHVKTIKQKDIIDQSMVSSISVMDDSRVKHLKVEYGIYPYTVEIESQVSAKGFLELPSWYLQGRKRVSVEHSQYTVVNTSGLDLRYKIKNGAQEPNKEVIPNGEKWVWDFESVSAIKPFEDHYPIWEQLMSINLYTEMFSHFGYSGSKKTWADFAQWNYDLQIGRGEIPEKLKAEVQELTSGKTQEEKIRLVYEWMQKHSRYVSIQLGIGGLQSMLSNDVYENEYGDCKALSNYTQSLLNVAGVSSLYTLIYGGEESRIFDANTPSFQFNHAILCVPNDGDTIWLECTSQTNPFGYQGRFTGDRYALLCEDGKGKLVRTTSYEAKDNVQEQFTIVDLQGDGDAKVNIQKKSTGIQSDRERHLSREGYEDQKKYLYKVLDVPNPKIESYEVKVEKDRIPVTYESIQLLSSKTVSKSGDRVFIRPNVTNRAGKVSSTKEERKFDFIFDFAYQDIDTVVWNLPKGYTVESLPKDKVIESKFGAYSTEVQTEEGKIIYIRQDAMWKGRYKPEFYKEYIKYQQAVYKNDKKRVVLKKIKT